MAMLFGELNSLNILLMHSGILFKIIKIQKIWVAGYLLQNFDHIKQKWANREFILI